MVYEADPSCTLCLRTASTAQGDLFKQIQKQTVVLEQLLAERKEQTQSQGTLNSYLRVM